jgi:hypothetical protein
MLGDESGSIGEVEYTLPNGSDMLPNGLGHIKLVLSGLHIHDNKAYEGIISGLRSIR